MTLYHTLSYHILHNVVECHLSSCKLLKSSVIIISDQRRMKEIRVYLTKLRLNPEKIDKPKKEVCESIRKAIFIEKLLF